MHGEIGETTSLLRFEILIAVLVKIPVFTDMMPRGLMDLRQFGETCFLHIQEGVHQFSKTPEATSVL
jgi:hypothetical protein